MATLRALIVDDSRTAQLRLKKLMHRYNLEIDLAASAEEALGYLSYKMPTVIFMDHHMEGMDGFAALKIIKANPSTATIPVIMYTSKSDNVYAGQAHALGALDTLSKNLMKPARVEEVLTQLNIFPAPGALETVTHKPAQNAAHVKSQAPGNSGDTRVSASEFKSQIARLFELHIADVRTQIAENTKFIVRRLAGEIRNASSHDKSEKDKVHLLVKEEPTKESSRERVLSNVLLGAIFVVLAAISIQLYRSYTHAQQLEEMYQQLTDFNKQQSADTNTTNSPENLQAGGELKRQYMLDTLSWALGTDMHFDYGEAPLNRGQILNLQNLTFRMYRAGFRGFIELTIHLGNFCLIQGQNGEWDLPAPETSLSQCTFLRDQNVDVSTNNYTNVAYLQFEQSTAPIQNGDIEYIINVNAFENPIYSYPDQLRDTNAGEWNTIASRNQQIRILMETAE